MTAEEKRANVRYVPMPDGLERMESGPIAFGDDWPGYFLRGDMVMAFAHYMGYVAYVLKAMEKGEPIDTRHSTQMMLSFAVNIAKSMKACVLIDDREEVGE